VATAGDATAWIATGWELFRKAPGPRTGILVVFFLINLAAGLLPIATPLVVVPLLAASYYRLYQAIFPRPQS